MTTVIHLGGDVSKGYADMCFLDPNGKKLPGSRRYDDTATGHAALRQFLTDTAARFPACSFEIAVEATGGLERNWLAFFHQLLPSFPGSHVYQLNPLVVRRFREHELHHNVTDPASAKDIACYLRSNRSREELPYEPADEGLVVLYRMINNLVDRASALQNELQCLLPSVHPDLVQFCRDGFPAWVLTLLGHYPTAAALSRAQVATVARIPYVTTLRATDCIAAAKQSVAALHDPASGEAVRHLAREITRLEEDETALKQRLCTLLEKDPVVCRLDTLPGIARWSAVVLRLELGSFQRFRSANALVAFAGLDPKLHESGDGTLHLGISKRGRSGARKVLYLNVMTALRKDNALRDYYDHLRARGKPHLVAVTACMAKLLRIGYACVSAEEDFDPDRYRRDRQAQQESTQASDASMDTQAAENQTPAPAAVAALKAPVTRREAQRRRAALQPQARKTERKRGPGAARAAHDTSCADASQEQNNSAQKP